MNKLFTIRNWVGNSNHPILQNDNKNTLDNILYFANKANLNVMINWDAKVVYLDSKTFGQR